MSEPAVSTVAGYLYQINRLLSGQTSRVSGEVISKKVYDWGIIFTIKDQHEAAVMDCMIWTRDYDLNGVELTEGKEIIVTGYGDVFPRNGRFSFKANTLEDVGAGALKAAYDKLKAKLDKEGLLAEERKRPLPDFVTKIGVITSKYGVVIQDFNTNLARRGYKITMVDSRVEGKDAIHELLAAIQTIAKQDIEALVIIRGGGSLESFQAFNTESVVRAIAGFKVPVITGIGHDSDVTLAEMVADIGRSTPTAVAEALNEPWDGMAHNLNFLERRTIGAYESWLIASQNQVNNGPIDVFHQYERQLTANVARLSSLYNQISSTFTQLGRRFREVTHSLHRATGIMKSNLQANQNHLSRLPLRLSSQFRMHINETNRSFVTLQKTIAINDPKRNMRLGYSLSYVNGKLARSVAAVKPGDAIITQLVDGEFTSEVKKVK